MKMKFFLFLIGFTISCISLKSQSLKIRAYGLYNTTIKEKIIANNIGISLGGFEPNYGYQFGALYQQNLFKSFTAGGEVGYLKKGSQTFNLSTRVKLYEINFNSIYFKPSLGYQWHGFTISAGLFFNFLLNENAVNKKTPHSTLTNPEIAYSYELSYKYKRIGLSISTNESISPVQHIASFGDEYDHYHHWYSVGLSYAIIKK